MSCRIARPCPRRRRARLTAVPRPAAAGDAGAFVGGVAAGVLGTLAVQHAQQARQPQRVYVQKQYVRPQVSSYQREANRQVQTSLNYFGFPAGTPDGVLGANSRAAIAQYQGFIGDPATGALTDYERTFLTSSYDRAIVGGAATNQAIAASGQGTRGLLLAYRQEQLGIPTTQAAVVVPPAQPAVPVAPAAPPAAPVAVPAAPAGVTEASATASRRSPAAMPAFIAGPAAPSMAGDVQPHRHRDQQERRADGLQGRRQARRLAGGRRAVLPRPLLCDRRRREPRRHRPGLHRGADRGAVRGLRAEHARATSAGSWPRSPRRCHRRPAQVRRPTPASRRRSSAPTRASASASATARTTPTWRSPRRWCWSGSAKAPMTSSSATICSTASAPRSGAPWASSWLGLGDAGARGRRDAAGHRRRGRPPVAPHDGDRDASSAPRRRRWSMPPPTRPGRRPRAARGRRRRRRRRRSRCRSRSSN